MAAAQNIDRLLRLDEVLHTTGLGPNTVYRRIKEGTFPKQVRIGPNSVAERQSDISQWMTELPPQATTNQYIDQYTQNGDLLAGPVYQALQVIHWKFLKSLLLSLRTGCLMFQKVTSAAGCTAIPFGLVFI